jgi:hypothetical protein
MRAIHTFIGSFFLVATIAAPGLLVTAARAQQASVQVRVYDRDHHDYHNWDEREDHAYRRYLNEQHRAYMEYHKQHHQVQSHYWNWRHEHPDHD